MERSTEAVAGAPPAAQPTIVTSDNPGIIAPGPVIAFGALLLGLAFDQLHLSRVINQVPSLTRESVALSLVSWGLWYNLPRQPHLLAHENAVPAVAADPRHRREGHLRPHPQSDVPGLLHHRARPRRGVPHRRRGADADPRRHAAALRRGAARGALSHPQVRRKLSPIHGRRAALRLGVSGGSSKRARSRRAARDCRPGCAGAPLRPAPRPRSDRPDRRRSASSSPAAHAASPSPTPAGRARRRPAHARTA